MANNKKYYYLKLKEDFFDTEELKILQHMPDGYVYSDILLKLYLISLRNDGRLMYKNVTPYTTNVIASLTNHQLGTVEKALGIFKDLGLIEILDNGAIYMLDIQNFIGEASTEAERKRQYRTRIASEKSLLDNAEGADEDTNVTISLPASKVSHTDNVRKIMKSWNSLETYGIKPVSKIGSSSKRYSCLVARIKEYGFDDVLKAIEMIKQSDFLQGKSDSKRHWVITFDWFVLPNNFPKVLEGNYSNSETTETSNGYGNLTERLLNESREDLF